MRKHFLTGIALLPLLASLCSATPCSASDQTWTVDPSVQPFGYGSEESGTSAYLGVDIGDVTSERVSALKLKDEKGVEITTVDQDAPAGKAGLKVHDVILSMNGTAVDSGAQIKRMIHETPAGRVVTLEISRDGQPLTIKVQLGDRRKQYAWTAPKDFHVEIPPIPNMPDIEIPEINVVMTHSSARSGLMVENLTPQLGIFFGVKDGDGVLVRSVEKGSRAEKAGFHAGDVIVKVNDQSVHDTNDFTRAIRSHGGGTTSVGVVRDKREQNINLTLPDRKDSGMMEQESLDEPTIDAETAIELSLADNELALLQPQMEWASEQSEDISTDTAQAQCEHMRQQARQKAHELRMQQKQMLPRHEKLQQDKEKLKIKMERLRHEMQGDWLDI